MPVGTQKNHKTDWVTPLGIIGGGAMLLWGATMLLKNKGGEIPKESIRILRKTSGIVPEGADVPVEVFFHYDGPAQEVTIEAHIGNHYVDSILGDIFSTKTSAVGVLQVPGNGDYSIDLSIPTGELTPGNVYDMTCQIRYPTGQIWPWDWKKFDGPVYDEAIAYALPGEWGYLALVDWTSPVLQGQNLNVDASFVYSGPTVSAQFVAALLDADMTNLAQGSKTVTVIDTAGGVVSVRATIQVPAGIPTGMYKLMMEVRWSGNTRLIDSHDIWIGPAEPTGEVTNVKLDYIGSPIQLGQGINLTISWDYQGPAQTANIYITFGVGEYGIVPYNPTPYPLTQSDTPRHYQTGMIIPSQWVYQHMETGYTYDCDVMVEGVPSPRYYGVLVVEA